MKNSRLLTIFLIVVVDLLGFSLILPLLPYYAESFGATPVIVGLLVASYVAAQLIGAPLLVVILPLALSGGVLNTVIQSSISKSVSRDEIGGILGISTSLEALTRAVAPSVGGFLLGYFDRWAQGVFTALLIAWAVSFAYRRIIFPAQRKGLVVDAEGSHA
jgi:MFS family permease